MEHLELLAPTLMLILNMLRAPSPPELPVPAAVERAAESVETPGAPDTDVIETAARSPGPAEETGVTADVAELAAPAAAEQAGESVETPGAPDADVIEAAARSPEPAEETGAAAEPPESRPPGRVKKTRGEWPAVAVFTEGLTGSYLTRIILQENRSNFVFEDYLAGLFFNVKTTPFKRANIMARLSAYYPLLFYFNNVPQPAANPIHYGADLFLGPVFEPNLRNLIRFDLSPGLHLFFENTDRWNYLHLGAAALAGIELPLSTRWTIYLDGLASFDYGNLGNNRTMEPYDIVYQYQVGIGVRYSKRTPNVRPWIKPRRRK